MALRRGPQTQRGLRAEYERLLHYMGLPVTFALDDRGWTFHRELEDNLAALVKRGLVVREGDVYRLTAEGEVAAEAAYQRARQNEDSFTAIFYSPATASKVSVASNGILVVVKLLMGFAFMSLSLVADGLDSLIDLLSTCIVLLGVRVGRELTSAAFMIAITGTIGGVVVYEGVSRLMQPVTVSSQPIVIAALAKGAEALPFCLSRSIAGNTCCSPGALLGRLYSLAMVSCRPIRLSPLASACLSCGLR